MVAVLADTPLYQRPARTQQRQLRLLEPLPLPSTDQPARAGLALARPEARPEARSQAPSVYRRRRLVAAGLALLVLAGLIVVVQAALVRVGGGPLTTTGADGLSSAAARVWVVQPGDTLWSIATTMDPHGDVRPLVDRLSAETKGQALYPGERIAIP